MAERLSEIASRIACSLEAATQHLPTEQRFAGAQAWLAIEIYRALVAERNAVLEEAAALCDRRVRECEGVDHEIAVAMQAEALCLAREMRDLKESEVPVTASAG